MTRSEEPIESGDDDWVKQALADAMLGKPTETAAPIEPPTPIEPAAPAVPAEPPTPIEPAPAAPVEPEPATEPPPTVASRLFERPEFDATGDPDVDAMIDGDDDQAPPPDRTVDDEERSQLRGVVEWLVVLGSAVIVALVLRAFLFQAFYIPSESMEETLRIDDRVLVNKLSYRLHDINRGDVVVFRRPEDDPGEYRDLIKRVIGLPGESIEARDNTIYIDGQVLIEPYLTAGEVIGDFGPIEIPDGEIFLMGDNRDNSGDSRVFGTIETDRVIGRAFFLFWPFDRAGPL